MFIQGITISSIIIPQNPFVQMEMELLMFVFPYVFSEDVWGGRSFIFLDVCFFLFSRKILFKQRGGGWVEPIWILNKIKSLDLPTTL